MKLSLFGELTFFEKILWMSSVLIIIISFLLGGEFDFVVLVASLIGATALIFVAKGDPLGQIITVIFALFYGYISFKFQYWGEMITYLGMTAPIAVAATIAWIKNPNQKGKREVRIKKLGRGIGLALVLVTIIVTWLFYFILKYFNTPNLVMSTISIATSFLASSLTFLRNPFYALAYAANDIVLIVLWVLASIVEPSYIPMVACFTIFFFNDVYGFINWQRMKRRQERNG